MRLEAISGYQIAWVVCPVCEELLPISEANKVRICPNCGCRIRLFTLEYGVELIDAFKNSGQN